MITKSMAGIMVLYPIIPKEDEVTLYAIITPLNRNFFFFFFVTLFHHLNSKMLISK